MNLCPILRGSDKMGILTVRQNEDFDNFNVPGYFRDLSHTLDEMPQGFLMKYRKYS